VVFRPFNYVLLREDDAQLTIEVRGFCRGDAGVRDLNTIAVPLAP
jgi:hypothetical protein